MRRFYLNIMEYPFKFSEINLTDSMLEKLGFAEWWGGSGDNMDSRIHLTGKSFDIHSIDEKDDEDDGYGFGKPRYVAYHYCDDKWNRLYFLHELYEYIKSGNCKEAMDDFLSRCEKCNLMPYIASYEAFLIGA